MIICWSTSYVHWQTSPADGRILHFGEVQDGILEQVKGVTYSLSGFLGPMSWQNDKAVDHSSDEEYHVKLNLKPDHKLYHCIIYLAPGDYHRFHSPTDWSVKYRRHFPGKPFVTTKFDKVVDRACLCCVKSKSFNVHWTIILQNIVNILKDYQ